MTPYLYLGGALLSVIALISSYAVGRHDGRQLQQAKQEEAAEIVALARDELTAAAVEAISQIEVKNVYKTQRLERETVEVPVYRDCKHSDDAFRLLNDALTPPEQRLDADTTELPRVDEVE